MYTFVYGRSSFSPRSQAAESYEFVEQPPTNFFCPVTKALLVQPQLTSCCGKHLSLDAVNRIQKEGEACPLCGTPTLAAKLDRNFQHQVNSLWVFCPKKSKGCGWRGKIDDLDLHSLACSKV